MEKEIAKQVQEAQRVPYRINPRRNTPRHILINQTKTKHKERILKASPGDLANPGTEHAFPALAGTFFTAVPPGKPVKLVVVQSPSHV